MATALSSTSTYTTKPIINIVSDTATTTLERSSINYVQLSQPFESHHTFEVNYSSSLKLNDIAKFKQVADDMIGGRISIMFEHSRNNVVEQNLNFLGIVTSVKMSKGQSNSLSFLISGTSATSLLSVGRNTCSFTDMTLADIVNKVLSSNSKLDKKVAPVYTSPIPYVTQYEEDNFHFLQRLAENYGEWMFYNGEELIFGKPSRSNPPVALAYGVNLFDMDYRLRTVPMNMKVQYYNYEESKLYIAPASAEAVSGLQIYDKMMYDKSEKLFTDELVELGFQDYKSESDLKRMVKLKKGERSNSLAVLSGSTPEMEIKVGGLIKVKEDIYAVTDSKQGSTRQDTIDYGINVFFYLNKSTYFYFHFGRATAQNRKTI